MGKHKKNRGRRLCKTQKLSCFTWSSTSMMIEKDQDEKFLYNMRIELSTHNMATPLSANTAIHMEA